METGKLRSQISQDYRSGIGKSVGFPYAAVVREADKIAGQMSNNAGEGLLKQHQNLRSNLIVLPGDSWDYLIGYRPSV